MEFLARFKAVFSAEYDPVSTAAEELTEVHARVVALRDELAQMQATGQVRANKSEMRSSACARTVQMGDAKKPARSSNLKGDLCFLASLASTSWCSAPLRFARPGELGMSR